MTPKQARVTILGNLAVWNVNGIIDQLESGYEKGVLREIVGAAEQLAKSTGWISVKERLPEEDDWYWVFIQTPTEKFVTTERIRGSNANPPDCITHWMPLPEPPDDWTI